MALAYIYIHLYIWRIYIERSENPRLTLPLLEFVALMQVYILLLYIRSIVCYMYILYLPIAYIHKYICINII